MGTARIRILGALCLFLAAAVWGGMYVVSQSILDYIPPMALPGQVARLPDCSGGSRLT